MPHTVEATVLALWPNVARGAEIASEQADYVRAVFARCPLWRWRKRRRLAGAVEHAELVERMCAVSARLTKEKTT